MMKKLVLMLTLVFGMASVANAHFIFKVDGEELTEITLHPCEVAELSLELSADEMIYSYQLDYVLSDANAELITDGASRTGYDPPLTDIEFPTVFDFVGSLTVNEPQRVGIAAGQFVTDPIQGPKILMNELYVHCLGEGDVVLTITVTGTTLIGDTGYEQIQDGTLLYTLVVHQVPEPATIALLGLGGLLLRRRKKQ